MDGEVHMGLINISFNQFNLKRDLVINGCLVEGLNTIYINFDSDQTWDNCLNSEDLVVFWICNSNLIKKRLTKGLSLEIGMAKLTVYKLHWRGTKANV